jgi:hypothetical protein
VGLCADRPPRVASALANTGGLESLRIGGLVSIRFPHTAPPRSRRPGGGEMEAPTPRDRAASGAPTAI